MALHLCVNRQCMWSNDYSTRPYLLSSAVLCTRTRSTMYREAFLKFTQLIVFISSLAIAHDNEYVEKSIPEFDFLPGFLMKLKNEPESPLSKLLRTLPPACFLHRLIIMQSGRALSRKSNILQISGDSRNKPAGSTRGTIRRSHCTHVDAFFSDPLRS